MSAWDGVVAEVAQMPGVADRLIAEHTPDAEGHRTACTSPGYGRPSAPWPCCCTGSRSPPIT